MKFSFDKLVPEGECLVWPYNRFRGYGRVYVGLRKSKSGRTVSQYKRAHRVAWEQAYGPIPKGMCVLHKCDNPPCCNIQHLFIGTKSDNNKDMAAKGRTANGRKTHCYKGHEFDEDNTYRPTRGRRCRQCAKDNRRAYYERTGR